MGGSRGRDLRGGEKNSGKAEAFSAETKKDGIKSVRGHMQIACPPPSRWYRTMLTGFPVPMIHPGGGWWGGEKAQGGHPAPPALALLLGSHHSYLTLWGLHRNLSGSTTGNDCDGEGPATTSTWILADSVSTCSTQVIMQTSFAHLQNQVSDAV